MRELSTDDADQLLRRVVGWEPAHAARGQTMPFGAHLYCFDDVHDIETNYALLARRRPVPTNRRMQDEEVLRQAYRAMQEYGETAHQERVADLPRTFRPNFGWIEPVRISDVRVSDVTIESCTIHDTNDRRIMGSLRGIGVSDAPDPAYAVLETNRPIGILFQTADRNPRYQIDERYADILLEVWGVAPARRPRQRS